MKIDTFKGNTLFTVTVNFENKFVFSHNKSAETLEAKYITGYKRIES